MIQRKHYVSRPYAPGAVEFCLRHQRANLWAKPGMGKTVITYSVLDAMNLCSLESRPTLVLGPLRVARDVWPTEAKKWDHLRDFTVSAIVGTSDERKAALKQDAMVYTMNYDNLPWLLSQLGDRWPFGTVIADESTRLKGFRLRQGGKRAQALSDVTWSQVNRWINLTGTPAANGLKDLWGQMWFIDKGARLGSSYSAFIDRWFYTDRGGTVLPFRHSDAEIRGLIKDVCLTIDPKDWYNIKDPIVTQINVQLPKAARAIYEEFEDTMYTELSCGSKLEVFNAAALTNKCLQIANGAVYHEGNGWKPVHDAKLEALESIAEETNEQLLVAYAFRSDLERIEKAFGKRAARLSEARGLAAWKVGDAQLGLAHPASMGHGVDGLQDYCNTLVRFGRDWNLENQLQMLERIGPMRQLQAGFERAVMVYDLVAENTIDEQVIARHESKQNVMDILMSAMKGANLV